jgi:tetratricopeptide (TPR) repeat protein
MLNDRYGLPLSTTSREACDVYVEGVDALLGAGAGVQRLLERAIDADPAFALAWVALARARFLEADVASARAAAAQARTLAAQATAREQGHVHAIALAIEGKPAEAFAATRVHLAEHPRDALVLAPATGVFGLIGFSGRADREAELHDLLDGLAPHYGADWWFECVHAFAECETGRLGKAQARIERSMAANPHNGHGAHVMAHVLHELGDAAAIEAFLAGWMPAYDPTALMHCHLSWHGAMAALALGHVDEAWQTYRQAVHPGGAWGPPLNVVTDAVSFLWRAELAGAPRAHDAWKDVGTYASRQFPKVGVAFADVHLAVAGAAAGDAAMSDRMTAELHERLTAGRLPAGEVVPLLVQAFAAFGRRDWDAAIERFERALPATVRIGGSRAQRDLVEHTLLAAYLHAGRADDAQRLIERRVDRRPPVEVAGFVRH